MYNGAAAETGAGKVRNVRLSPKQALFVREYLIDLNATQAAIRAGYSAKTARQQAADLLAKPDIAEEIARLAKARVIVQSLPRI